MRGDQGMAWLRVKPLVYVLRNRNYLCKLNNAAVSEKGRGKERANSKWFSSLYDELLVCSCASGILDDVLNIEETGEIALRMLSPTYPSRLEHSLKCQK